MVFIALTLVTRIYLYSFFFRLNHSVALKDQRGGMSGSSKGPLSSAFSSSSSSATRGDLRVRAPEWEHTRRTLLYLVFNHCEPRWIGRYKSRARALLCSATMRWQQHPRRDSKLTILKANERSSRVNLHFFKDKGRAESSEATCIFSKRACKRNGFLVKNNWRLFGQPFAGFNWSYPNTISICRN